MALEQADTRKPGGAIGTHQRQGADITVVGPGRKKPGKPAVMSGMHDVIQRHTDQLITAILQPNELQQGAVGVGNVLAFKQQGRLTTVFGKATQRLSRGKRVGRLARARRPHTVAERHPGQ
ncbi:hypothetical protein SDC9_175234 [bioreactor metagenome]|uniref:Uncharacterized protein n=1 Tax=bioreactor metagenome TaxID=1076179 RepID=A0A645GNN4_9ZZZZ